MLMILCLAGYSIFGLGLSAIPIIKKLGIVFSMFGLLILSNTFIKRQIKLAPLFYIYILFFTYIIISSFWSPAPLIGNLTGMFSILASSLMVVLALHLKLVSYKNLLIILMLPGVFNLVAYIFGINIQVERHDGSEASLENAMSRFGGFVGHPNTLVTRCLLPLIFITFFYEKLKDNQNFKFILFPMAIGLSIFIVIASGSKKSVIITCACLSILCFQKVNLSKVLLLTLAVILSILLLSNFDFNDSSVTVINRINQMLEGEDDSTLERLLMVKMAPIIFEQNMFFGAGLNGFAYESGIGAYAHNNLLELAASGGLVGLILYYPIFLFCMYRTFRERNINYALLVTALFIFFDITSVIYMDRAGAILLALFLYQSLLIKDDSNGN